MGGSLWAGDSQGGVDEYQIPGLDQGRHESIKAAMQRAAECTACSWHSKSKGCKQCLGQWEPNYRLTEAAYQFWVGQETQK